MQHGWVPHLPLSSCQVVDNLLMRVSAMGMQHGWVPHLPPGTGSSAPHVLHDSHTLQSHCCMFHHHSRCADMGHLRLPEIYAQSTTVIRTSMAHAFVAHAAMHQIQLEYSHRTTIRCASKPTRLRRSSGILF